MAWASTQLSAPIPFTHDGFFIGGITISAALWIVGVLNAQFVRDYLAAAPRFLDEAVSKVRPEMVEIYAAAINAHSRYAFIQNRITVAAYFSVIQTVMLMGMLALFAGIPVWWVRLAALWSIWSQLHDIFAIRRASHRASADIIQLSDAPNPSWFSKLNGQWDERSRRFRMAVEYALLIAYVLVWLAPPDWIPYVFYFVMPLGIWAATSIIIGSVLGVLEATPSLNLLRYPDAEHLPVTPR